MASATFEPQPLTAPLNDTALESLQALAQQTERDQKLRKRLKDAAELLTLVTGDLNDRAYERRIKHGKEQARRQAEGGEVQDAAAANEADIEYEKFQHKVETLTKKMDMSIRGIIDDQMWLHELPDTLKRVANAAHTATQTQRTNYAPSPTPAEEAANANGEGNDDDEDAPRSSTRASQRGIHPADTPHIQLAAALAKQSRAWTSKSLTERYARNNDYRGWYRVLYDSKHPGESAPPMPDESIWFAAEEGRDTMAGGHRQRGHTAGRGASHDTDPAAAGDEGSSDAELEIAAETVRLKCPITLLHYVDPVTSKNCNHSYERTAILSMLQTSSDHAPFTESQLVELTQAPNNRERARREKEMRVAQVKCPECNVSLTEADLQPNPVLKRRVARVLAKRRKDETATSDIDADDDEADDDDDNDDDARGTQGRPVGVGSSPAPPTDPRTAALRRVKAERLSSSSAEVAVIPQTQLSGAETRGTQRSRRGAPRVLDVDDDDENDEADDA